MCGIVGLIDTSGEGVHHIVPIMRDAMVTRGPDGVGDFREGPVMMSMRRLSVIDIEHGGQPLTSQNGQVVAFQNGEIYNHVALRKELETDGFSFRTRSDTEVLSHGFARWGIEGLLERIDGMYAMAILDRKNRQLHLARDRFGEKPLFYCHDRGRFAYGSNLIALAALPWVDHDIDPVGLDRYLALHFVPGDRTIIKGVHRVLPGERLLVAIDDPVPERHRYYRIPIGRERRVSDDELASQIEDAVVSRLVSDVPVGVFLSGGLDSSIVATIAARHSPCIDTFSVGFHSKDHDESVHAKHVARAIGSNHHHFMFDEESFGHLLPQVAASLDEPVGDQAMLPLFWLCREAKKHVTVVLSGEGADEVFAGYDYYGRFASEKGGENWFMGLLRRSFPKLLGGDGVGHRSGGITPSGFPLLTDHKDRESLMGRSTTDDSAWEQETISWLDRAASPLQKASGFDMATWLPDDLLVKYDRMAMAHSLEGRAPFLQPRLVESGLRLPSGDRMADGMSKIGLRRAAGRWLSRDILDRRKQGFVLPMADWLERWFQDHGGVEPYFSARAFPGLDTGHVCRMVAFDLKRGVRRQRLIFSLILLTEWCQSYSARVHDLSESYRKSA
ncbi:MAG: asparagine synthase (glutamine-hydrolyzing) [Nitrospirae bacterium]|nr:asparagine synthase (glutamine-hydrolyzing) [Nitrospirota bacterium]